MTTPLSRIFLDNMELPFGEANVLTREFDMLYNKGKGNNEQVSIRVGSTFLTQSDGLEIINPSTGEVTIKLDAGGNTFFGGAIALPASTSFVTFGQKTVYNGEAFDAGDTLTGDNSSGKANMKWDIGTGQLQFRGGTTIKTYIDTDGTIHATDGVFSGELTATSGTFGGWTISGNTLVGGNIILDAGNDRIDVGTGSGSIRIDGTNKYVRSNNYSSGVSGWNIGGDGEAEFHNLLVRGELKTTVFTANEIHVTGGTQMISKRAGKTHASFTTPATTGSLEISNDGGGATCSFANGEIVRIKNSSVDFWGTLSAKSQGADSATFTVTRNSGSSAVVIAQGSAIAGYDGTAGGTIYLSADGGVGSTANISISDHSTAPWSDEALKVRIGNINGSYGSVANEYGIGIGDYSGNNYLSYNVGGSDAFVIKAGAGSVTLNASGITATAGTIGGWTIGATTIVSGNLVLDGGNEKITLGSGSPVVLDADDGITLNVGSSPGTPYAIKWDSGASNVARAVGYHGGIEAGLLIETLNVTPISLLTLRGYDGATFDTATGTGAIILGSGDYVVVRNDLRVAQGIYAGSEVVNPASGTVNASVGMYAPLLSATTDGIGGGVFVGSDGQFYRSAANRIRTPDALQVDGTLWFGSAGDVALYRTAANILRTPDNLQVDASIYIGTTDVRLYRTSANVLRTPDSFRVDGNLYTTAWTNYFSSATKVGWSSYTASNMYYKKVGNLVFVTFEISGTSNSTSTTVTLPHAVNKAIDFTLRVQNNGTFTHGTGVVSAGGSTVTFYRTPGGAGWTASGTKSLYGQFFYEV